MPKSPSKKKRKKKLRKKKATPKAASNDPRIAELEETIREYCDLANRLDAIEDLMAVRKKRAENLMADMGLSRQEATGFGTAAFSERRSFKVIDQDALAKLMSKKQLAALAKITADVYDAAKAEKVAIDEAVQVGKTPSLSISRSRKKLARERQKKHIAEARKAAEARIEAHRAEWRTQAGA